MAHKTGKQVQICTRNGTPRWNDLWQGIDWIATPYTRGDYAQIRNAPGCRPYIVYPWSGGAHAYTNFRVCENIGAIQFTESEFTWAMNAAHSLGEFIIVEPTIAKQSNKNKQWGWEKWQTLVKLMPDLRWIQIGPKGTRLLQGVQFVQTGTFRLGAALLARSKLAVLPEGGLHHAAGVMGKKAIVLFGGTTSVYCLAYPHHIAIADTGPASPCGNWRPCKHCQEAWAKITPEMVKEQVEKCL